MNALVVSGLRKSFVRHLFDGKRIDVLRGVDLELERGTCTLVTGPSGSGKSSLLRCIYRSCVTDAGTIVLHDDREAVDLTTADERTVLRLRKTSIGMATQFLSVVPRVAALDLVCSEGLDRDRGAALLRDVGLPHEMLDVPPATFSGGQRQMLNLALALARPRPLLLLDEVTASLDPARKRAAHNALLERKRSGITMLMVSHEMPEVSGLVDRVVRVEGGVIAA